MAFKLCSIGTKGPNVQKKISPTPLHHHQPEPLRQGRMDPCFHVLYAKFWPCHLNVAAEIETQHTRQCFSNLLLSNFVSLCEMYPPFPVLSWQEQHPVWSSAAVDHLLQGLTCCAFRDGFLHTLVVMSAFLSSLTSLPILLWHQQGIFETSTRNLL